jgi:ABC-2 type transport system ATP-binding protein
MTSPLIQTNGLSFSFRKDEVTLRDLQLEVYKGSIYGFLGPNGAGKTTTLRLLLGLLKVENNPISIFGKDLNKHRLDILRRIGSLIEQPSLYGHLTARENLEVFRLAYSCKKERIDDVLEIVGLTHASRKKTKAYSLGMKQRLAIAITLLHDPDLLILDEPTNGLDPTGIIEMRELITRLNKDYGKTVLVSSHLLAEVEKIATHVGIIHQGNLLFQGTLTELQQLKSTNTFLEIEVDDVESAKRLLHNRNIRQAGDFTLHVAVENRESIAALNRTLVQNQIKVYKMIPAGNNLEELFIQIISK